ncbi:probable E3 ubiquitin-protein ligase RHY1A [Camellia sinensis]|uniref:RING-type domain-containing protein n=1 Tax=Camellia sinensis var. sinensis TaxID=542762 RepID=A0A4S4EUW7_CAMSN|nr:probable E3 ubiquitin-protein ligase RHY1A [Camellia sinensis]THG20750.1 hypothetical protein TEA_003824 [Camellia sinensis var. sinensis]
MTRASGLFYNRRSRFVGRNTGIDLGLDSSLDRSSTFHHQTQGNRRRRRHHQQHHSNSRRDRHDLDGFEPLPRSPHIIRQSSHHRSSHLERDTVQLDEGSSQSSSENIINSDNVNALRNRLRLNGNERLPGAVLLARERLLERLRGVSLSGDRQSNTASSGINRSDLTFWDAFRLIVAGDLETETSREWLSGDILYTDPMSQTDQLLGPQEISNRPPGLTQEALGCLQMEVFSNTECSDEAEKSRASRECGICLESFLEGDELICLPCGHKFHSCCLDPWVRTCGDCPYCRRGIVVTSPIEQ